jgi:hypothetical protein
MHVCVCVFVFLRLLVIKEYENMLSLVRICWLGLLWFFAEFFNQDKIFGIVLI